MKTKKTALCLAGLALALTLPVSSFVAAGLKAGATAVCDDLKAGSRADTGPVQRVTHICL